MKKVLSDNLKRLRLGKNLTQEQVAEVLGISAQSVSRWECGNTYPDVMLLPDIARLYGVTVDDLYRPHFVAYDNYAQRLASVYDATRDPIDFMRADAEFRRLIAAGTPTAEDMRFYGIIHQFMMKYCMDKAEGIFNDIISGKFPDDKGAVWLTKHQRQGFLQMIGRGQESITRQLKVVEEGSRSSRDWVLLIDAYLMAGEVENAKVWSKKALKMFPEESMIWGSCGDVYEELKQYDRALECWEKALELDPELYDCRYSIGFCYEKMGQYQKAYEVWCDVVQRLERDVYEMELAFPKGLAQKCKEKLEM